MNGFCQDELVGGAVSTQEIEAALAVVRLAIRNEIAGQRFYGDAAYYCVDLWAKEIFATLAEEEDAHARLLLREYQALTTQGRWIDLEVVQASDEEVDITRIHFSDDELAGELFPLRWSVDEAVDRRADDLAALAFGIKMEEEAVDLYDRAARETTDPAAKQAYQFLIREETRHYRQLKDRWETLAGTAFVGA